MVFSYVLLNMLSKPSFPTADFMESMMYGLAIFGFLFPAVATSYTVLDTVTNLFSHGSSILCAIDCRFRSMLFNLPHMLSMYWISAMCVLYTCFKQKCTYTGLMAIARLRFFTSNFLGRISIVSTALFLALLHLVLLLAETLSPIPGPPRMDLMTCLHATSSTFSTGTVKELTPDYSNYLLFSKSMTYM
jgi:hypothetical protein